MGQYTQMIVDKLSAAAVEQTQQIQYNLIQQVYQDMFDLVTKLNESEQKLTEFFDYVDRLKSMGMSKAGAEATAISDLHWSMTRKQAESELLMLALEAYEIIVKVREFFTHEPILYQIGIMIKKKTEILQTEMTFEELAPRMKVEYHRGSFNIRIPLTQKYMKEAIKNRGIADDEVMSHIEHITQGASTLYSTMYRYFYDMRLDPNQKSPNWGNFYEAYLALYYQHDNNYKPSVSEMANTFKNIMANTEAFSKGGDVNNKQVKLQAATPTLTSTATLSRQLTELMKIFNVQNLSREEAKQALQDMFIKEQADTEIEAAAIEECTQQLKETFASLSDVWVQ